MTPDENLLLKIHNSIYTKPAEKAVITDNHVYFNFYFVYPDGKKKPRYNCGITSDLIIDIFYERKQNND